MSTVQKTYADFTNGLRTDQFHLEIVNSPINIALIGVQTVGNNIFIQFESELSNGELTQLDSVIAAHMPDNSKPKNRFFIVTPKTSVSTAGYTVVSTFKYPGYLVSGPINYIEIMSYMEASITSYDVRIINRDTGDIIAEKTANTNTDLAVVDLGTISNVPAEDAILELHVRKNGGGKVKQVTIDNLIIYYNN